MIRAACHIHSEWSYDGKWSLKWLAEEFGRRGYRVLLITEHDRGFSPSRLEEHRNACREASSEKVLLVPGIEYSDAANQVHILAWGKLPFLGEGTDTVETLRQINAGGGVAVFAHPARRDAWRVFDPGWETFLLGMEVWNRKTDGWAPSPAACELIGKTSLLPFVGMDFHDRNQMFPLSMTLEVAGGVTEVSVMDALRAKHLRAMAFGRPLEKTLRGWRISALQTAEFCRRKAAARVRGWRTVNNKCRVSPKPSV